MGIYCGVDVLDDGGYMFRYRDSKLTIFEAMKQKGYETYYNDFQPQCFPSSVRRGIDDIYYSVGYDLGALWSYRLSHYAKLSGKGQLNDEDFKTLRAIFDDNLREWIQFTDDVLNNDKSVNMIIGKAAGYNERVRAIRREPRRIYSRRAQKGDVAQLVLRSGIFPEQQDREQGDDEAGEETVPSAVQENQVDGFPPQYKELQGNFQGAVQTAR